MKPQKNNESLIQKERRMLPFLIEFVKFSIGFTVLIAIGLFILHAVGTTMKL